MSEITDENDVARKQGKEDGDDAHVGAGDENAASDGQNVTSHGEKATTEPAPGDHKTDEQEDKSERSESNNDDAGEIFDAINQKYTKETRHSAPQQTMDAQQPGEEIQHPSAHQRRRVLMERMATKPAGVGAHSVAGLDDKVQSKLKRSFGSSTSSPAAAVDAARQQRHDELAKRVERDARASTPGATQVTSDDAAAKYARKVEGQLQGRSSAAPSQLVGAVSVRGPAKTSAKQDPKKDSTSNQVWINSLLDEDNGRKSAVGTVTRSSMEFQKKADGASDEKAGMRLEPAVVATASTSMSATKTLGLEKGYGSASTANGGGFSPQGINNGAPKPSLSSSRSTATDQHNGGNVEDESATVADTAATPHSNDDDIMTNIDIHTTVGAHAIAGIDSHSHQRDDDYDLQSDLDAADDNYGNSNYNGDDPSLATTPDGGTVLVAARAVEEDELAGLQDFRHQLRSELDQERNLMAAEIRREVQRDILTNVVAGEVVHEVQEVHDTDDPIGNRKPANGDAAMYARDNDVEQGDRDMEIKVKDAISQRTTKNRRIIAVLSCLVIAVAGVLAGIFLGQSSGSDGNPDSGQLLSPVQVPTEVPTEMPTKAPTESPSNQPTSAPTSRPTSMTPFGDTTLPPVSAPAAFDMFEEEAQLLAFGVSGNLVLEEDTPQSAALNWIINEDRDFSSTLRSFDLRDRYIVTLLYFSLGGDGWIDSMGFLTPRPICEWNVPDPNIEDNTFGFVCPIATSDVWLTLTSNNLTGTIPEEIRFLSLAVIDLRDNKITGKIPQAAGNLNNLEWILLSDNDLTGIIPPKVPKLPDLIALFLEGNRLSGSIPTFNYENRNLRRVQLSQRNCGKLSGNIETILDSIRGSIFEVLSVNCADLTGTLPPEAFTRLSNLYYIDISNSRVSGSIPTEVAALRRLEYLILNDNDLSGPIPSKLAIFGIMQSIQLSNNRLSGTLPGRLNTLDRLVRFEVQGNSLNGTVPAFPVSLDSLQTMNLQNEADNNDFVWIVENFLRAGSRKNLQSIQCSNCRLRGSLPTYIGDMSQLRYLHLTNRVDEGLTGMIPPELNALEFLEELHLSRNSFSNKIPTGLGQLTALTQLRLDDNNFTGTIPAEVATLASLKVLELQNNPSLGGELNSAICDLTDGSAFRFVYLSADCGANDRVPCSCCTECF